MKFATIDGALDECRRRKYRVTALMQLFPKTAGWRFSLRIYELNIFRDAATPVDAINEVFAVLDAPVKSAPPRAKTADDWV